MSEPSKQREFDREMRRLEARIDDLLDLCAQLREENQSLQQKQEALVAERAGLLQKNEQVRSRVESMVTRLKTMEQGS